MSHTLTDPSGRLIEYRRDPNFPGVLMLECRVLRDDGTPHDNWWHRVSDAQHHLMQLDKRGRDVLAAILGV